MQRRATAALRHKRKPLAGHATTASCAPTSDRRDHRTGFYPATTEVARSPTTSRRPRSGPPPPGVVSPGFHGSLSGYRGGHGPGVVAPGPVVSLGGKRQPGRVAGHHSWSILRDELVARVGEDEYAARTAVSRAAYERLERSRVRRFVAIARAEVRDRLPPNWRRTARR